MLLPARGERHVRRPPARTPCPAPRCSSGSRAGSRSRSSSRTPTSSRSPARSSSRRSPAPRRRSRVAPGGPQRRDRAAPRLDQDRASRPATGACWSRTTRCCPCAGGSGSGCCGRWTRPAPGAQLRTQLWIVYDAVQKTADLPLGNVVDAAFLFEHIQTRVLQSGVLLAGNLRDDRQAEAGGGRRASLPALRPDLPDRAVAARGTGRRGHPGQRRDARRPARHRPDRQQRRIAQEGRRRCSTSWSPPGRSCGSRTSTGCRPARGASGTRRTRRR